MMKPYIMVGRKSNKGFNTTQVRSRAETSVQIGAFKTNVNVRRINRETFRHKLALACFVSAPRLVRS